MLIASVLQASLTAVFESMTDGDDSKFTSGLLSALVSYIATGQVATTDAGNVVIPGTPPIPAVFTGAGIGTITVKSTDGQTILEDAIEEMPDSEDGNLILSEGISDALDNMINNSVIVIAVTGTITPPTPPAPYAGSSVGEATGQKEVLKLAIYGILNSMNYITTGGDAYLAEKLALAVTTYLTTLIITSDGTANLVGVSGTGGFA